MSSRVLQHYPSSAARNRALGVVVLVTVTLYYALYVKGSVAPQIIDEFDMSLGFYVSISIIGNLLGSFAALSSAITDRVGRSALAITGTGHRPSARTGSVLSLHVVADRYLDRSWDRANLTGARA